MENAIQRKIQQAEDTYLDNRRKIERNIEALSDEKRVFFRKIEQMADQVRTSARRIKSSNMPNIASVYRLLEQAQDEGQHIIKKALYSLEDKLEENQSHYRKQLANYEEEQEKLKNKGGD